MQFREGFVEDLRIDATIKGIDGPGGLLGLAGPTTLNSAGLPVRGVMQFDEADATRLLNYGAWEDVVLHEMLHVVGFGTIWEREGLLSDVGGTTRFTGENAIAAYEEVFPEIAAGDQFSEFGVPVETDFGPGTAFGHWDEETFGDELMTGIAGINSTLTDLTIASLEDLGYETVFDDALALV